MNNVINKDNNKGISLKSILKVPKTLNNSAMSKSAQSEQSLDCNEMTAGFEPRIHEYQLRCLNAESQEVEFWITPLMRTEGADGALGPTQH